MFESFSLVGSSFMSPLNVEESLHSMMCAIGGNGRGHRKINNNNNNKASVGLILTDLKLLRTSGPRTKHEIAGANQKTGTYFERPLVLCRSIRSFRVLCLHVAVSNQLLTEDEPSALERW